MDNELSPKALKEIKRFFTHANRRVFRWSDLQKLLGEHELDWELPSRAQALDAIFQQTKLREVLVRSEKYSSIKRYAWPEFSPLELALSLRPNAYLSHGTALMLWGLTEQIYKTIYVNQEQSAKPRPTAELLQESLDRAFRSQQRTSSYAFSYGESKFVLLSGKQTERLEVTSLKGEYGEPLTVTKIERTLIDVVVRPGYAGGISQVLDAYRAARNKASASVLTATLKKLDYIYPYQQSIGFLMERAGFKSTQYEKLSALGLNFDFYLVHGMREPAYDPKWRLYFPKGL